MNQQKISTLGREKAKEAAVPEGFPTPPCQAKLCITPSLAVKPQDTCYWFGNTDLETFGSAGEERAKTKPGRITITDSQQRAYSGERFADGHLETLASTAAIESKFFGGARDSKSGANATDEMFQS